MRYKVATVLALIGILGAAVVCWVYTRRPRDYSMHVMAPLPGDAKGWAMCWAGGLVCVGNDVGSDAPVCIYVVLTASGRTEKSFKTLYDGVPQSVECRQSVVYAIFSHPSEGWFLGALDLETRRCARILSGRTAYWNNLPIFYYRGQFWSPDHDRLLALPFARRRLSDSVIVVDRRSHQIVERRFQDGKVTSWSWSNEKTHALYVLTVRPGVLYSLRGRTEVRVPALDDAKAGMLSPRCDQAIGFRARQHGAFLVDLDDPAREHPLKATDGAVLSRTHVVWAIWSPQGTRIALLVSESRGKAPKLYVGDPSQPLQAVACPAGFRFPNESDYVYQLSGLSAVWSDDSTRVFALLVDKKASTPSRLRFAVGRVDVP